MSIIRPEQLEQPFNVTGSLYGTSSWAEYVVNAGVTQIIEGDGISISPIEGTGAVIINVIGGGGGGGGGTIPQDILNNAVGEGNSITFTRESGETFVVTIATGSGGGGGVGGFPFTGSAIISGSLTVTGSLDVTGRINNVKQLIQTLYQTDTSSPPDAYTLVNTTGVSFEWTRESAGVYRLRSIASAVFTEKRTIINITPGLVTGARDTGIYVISYEILDQATIEFIVRNAQSGEFADAVLEGTSLDIRIFP